MTTGPPQPFELHVPDTQLENLARRLESTRLPDQAPGEPWAHGADVDWVAELVRYWRHEFDWRVQEAALNAFPQYRTELHGKPLHFIHVHGKGPSPMPLLLSHGWPGSVFEFLDLIPQLTDPARFGRDPADSFTVVVPSLPGYGLSFRSGQRCDISEITDVLAELMTEVLGYERFAAQGGDWGARVATSLAISHPEKLIGIHLNFMPFSQGAVRSEDEHRYVERQLDWRKREGGYARIQGTKPQTLAFALTDSPAGLAAWIGEKFYAWTDHEGDAFEVVDPNRVLANIALYWFTGAIGSSFWPYRGLVRDGDPLGGSNPVDVPTGYAAFPAEIKLPPRSMAEAFYGDIRRWTEMEHGGHFAALEQPEALAGEVKAFFRGLR